jgi:hypothetical protein
MDTADWEHTGALATRESVAAPWRALTEEALSHVAPLRAALAGYRRSADLTFLDAAFAAAQGLIAGLPWLGSQARPELEELRWVARTVPEFDELLTVAAGEAERAICTALLDAWVSLGLRAAQPGWTATELESARMLFACTCAIPQPGEFAPGTARRIPTGLRSLAAGRMALALTGELARDEDLWRRTLGPRYDSVRHRYARRTTWRDRGLADLLSDEATHRAVKRRLERWLTDGGRLPALSGELEAALVHERTPARFA